MYFLNSGMIFAMSSVFSSPKSKTFSGSKRCFPSEGTSESICERSTVPARFVYFFSRTFR